MSTRSLIGLESEDGTVSYIYCHFDGYPDHENGVGHTLRNFYHDADKILDLLDYGDRSCLNEYPSSTDSYAERGESSVGMKLVSSKSAYLRLEDGVSYVYLFTMDDEWIYSGHDRSWVSLG